jgi:hypothetical protein
MGYSQRSTSQGVRLVTPLKWSRTFFTNSKFEYEKRKARNWSRNHGRYSEREIVLEILWMINRNCNHGIQSYDVTVTLTTLLQITFLFEFRSLYKHDWNILANAFLISFQMKIFTVTIVIVNIFIWKEIKNALARIFQVINKRKWWSFFFF